MTEHEAPEPSAKWIPPWNIEGARVALRARMNVRDDSPLGRRIRLTLMEAGGLIFPRLDLFPERLIVHYRDNLVRFEFRNIGSIAVEGDHVVLASGDAAAATRCLIYPDGFISLALVTSTHVRHR